MRIQKWNGVPGQFVAELHYTQGGEIYDAHSDKKVDVKTEAALEHDEPYELVIEFRSSGYYDPGVLSGPPEKCYPPEGDDEREMESVTLIHESGDIKLTPEEQEEFFEWFRSNVEEVEIDTQDDDGGRY